MAKTHWGNTPLHGYVKIYFTEQETRTIAEEAGSIGGMIGALIPDPHLKSLVGMITAALPWKARRCLKHGKCLCLTVGGLAAIPTEYTPGVDDIPPEATWNWS